MKIRQQHSINCNVYIMECNMLISSSYLVVIMECNMFIIYIVVGFRIIEK